MVLWVGCGPDFSPSGPLSAGPSSLNSAQTAQPAGVLLSEAHSLAALYGIQLNTNQFPASAHPRWLPIPRELCMVPSCLGAGSSAFPRHSSLIPIRLSNPWAMIWVLQILPRYTQSCAYRLLFASRSLFFILYHSTDHII